MAAHDERYIRRYVALRRDLHAHPELAFAEHRTAACVADVLHELGYQVTTGLGGTGVVGTLQRGQGGRRIGLRADMDALPITEQSTHAWRSQRNGIMHACGHDGHTATLLAAAEKITHAQFNGTVHLIFQPAEEGGAGAARMMADGLFDQFPCDQIFAFHNMPGIPAGHFVFRSGAFMASSDYVTLTFTGKGGHGAMPHTSDDPIVAASSIVMALQTIVSRNIDPLHTAVITVGAFHAGQANNVIPEQAVLELSVRALDPTVRALLKTRLLELVEAQACSYRVKVDIAWRDGYPVLINDAQATAFAAHVAQQLVGAAQVTPHGQPLTGSEDFAYMLAQVPGCYLLVGNGGFGTAGACMVHNPNYDFNDEILPITAQYWCRLVEAYLP